jgi:cytochrome oxidase Cu insertion factor (SCO1/SenC/PrrC family)
MSDPVPQRRSRRVFWIAAILFLGPFMAAFVIYRWFPEVLPQETTNYGHLITPPRPMPELAFEDADAQPVTSPWSGHWSLVYLAPQECETACRERMHFAHQLWLALNDKRAKLQRVYIAPEATDLAAVRAALGAEHADLRWLGGVGTTHYDLRRFFEIRHTEALYLIDPLGNWVMTYAPTPGEAGVQEDFKGMQKDLKKLLKL